MARAALQQLTDDVRARLADEPDVVVAYLFGSQVKGTAGPTSDADVAVLLDETADTHWRKLALMSKLGSRADVVVLNEAPPALGYRVLRDGVLLFSRDERARAKHWVHTVDRYLDMAPVRRVQAEALRRRIEEGRFGGR